MVLICFALKLMSEAKWSQSSFNIFTSFCVFYYSYFLFPSFFKLGPLHFSPFMSSLLLLQERLFLTISNYIFTAIFVAEMTVKVKCLSFPYRSFTSSFSPLFCFLYIFLSPILTSYHIFTSLLCLAFPSHCSFPLTPPVLTLCLILSHVLSSWISVLSILVSLLMLSPLLFFLFNSHHSPVFFSSLFFYPRHHLFFLPLSTPFSNLLSPSYVSFSF